MRIEGFNLTVNRNRFGFIFLYLRFYRRAEVGFLVYVLEKTAIFVVRTGVFLSDFGCYFLVGFEELFISFYSN